MTAALLLARQYWKLAAFGILALLLAASIVRGNHFRNQRDETRINLNECREGRKQDRTTYEQAQRDAKAKNDAEVKRIETEQEKINADAKSRYERDLRRLRAVELRKDLAAPKGSAGCTEASADGKTAPGADGENVCVPRSLLMRAAEIELGRNSLIDWIERQLKVER